MRNIFLILFSIQTLISCERKFDEPPQYIAPNIVANTSIKDLRAMHVSGNFEKINDSIVISGIVVADDRSGNFYKQICIQDATAGITISLNGTGLYTSYPIGRQIFIKCKGLWLGDYGRMLQLGGSVDSSSLSNLQLNGIPSSLFDTYLIKGTLNNTVVPKAVAINQLNDSLQSMLIQLNNVQFVVADTSKFFGDTSVNKNSVSLSLTNCIGHTMAVRTSAFSTFSNVKPQQGNGSIMGIYSVYYANKQLVVRDTGDQVLTDTRCTNTVPINLFTEKFSSVSNNAAVNIAGWKNIAEVGNQVYTGYVASSTSKYAKISGFGSAQSTIVSWLITPAITIPAATINPYLNFQTIDGYDNGATLQALISMDYTGNNNPSNATWTKLPAIISRGHASSYGNNTSSGNIDLSAYKGKRFYIAFRYDGSDGAGAKKTTTFEITNVNIIGY